MIALVFIGTVWLGIAYAYLRTIRAAKAAGRSIVWRPTRTFYRPPEPSITAPFIGPQTAATRGMDYGVYYMELTDQ